MKRFILNRKKDATGVSGTGLVASGIQFNDGSIAMRWNSKTPTTELLESLEDLLRIHGHGGASEVSFIDDSEPDKLLAECMSKSLNSLSSSLFISIKIDENSSVLKSLTDSIEKSLYISIDADNAGNKIALAESKDDENEARRVSNKINAGLNLFKEWIKNSEGYIIELGGDEGLGKIPEFSLKKLKSFAREYSDLTDFTLTIGVGKKLSQATKARMLGKLKGKNRIEIWHNKKSKEEFKKLIENESTNPVDKLRSGGFIKSSGAGSRGGKIDHYTSSGNPVYQESSGSRPPKQEDTTRSGEKVPTHLFKPGKKHLIGVTPFGRAVHHESKHLSHKNFTNVDHEHAAMINHHLAHRFPEGSSQRLKHEINRNDHILEAAKNQNLDPKKLLNATQNSTFHPSEKYMRANKYFINPEYVTGVTKEILGDKRKK